MFAQVGILVAITQCHLKEFILLHTFKPFLVKM